MTPDESSPNAAHLVPGVSQAAGKKDHQALACSCDSTSATKVNAGTSKSPSTAASVAGTASLENTHIFELSTGCSGSPPGGTVRAGRRSSNKLRRRKTRGRWRCNESPCATFVTCYDTQMIDLELTPEQQGMWDDLWLGIRELCEDYPNGIVFIGGVGVYLHTAAVKHVPGRFIEFSHDGDFYMDHTDFHILRSLEDVTTNARLKKSQLIKHGMEFDIYEQYTNGLLVKYEDAVGASEIIDGVRVACLEHLLLLKLVAYKSRKGRNKGDKDERDLIRICYMLSQQPEGPREDILLPYLDTVLVETLDLIRTSRQFITLAAGNTHHASTMRKLTTKSIDAVGAMLGDDDDSDS